MLELKQNKAILRNPVRPVGDYFNSNIDVSRKIRLLNPCFSARSWGNEERAHRDRPVGQDASLQPRDGQGWCRRSLHQEGAVATISLTVVQRPPTARGSAGLGLHPGGHGGSSA